ncbi:hypothetical protein CHT97_08980 [Lacticaseibacillus chiayiensis]|nr:hypothetical protein CHT97_08980 [Lacticaseibacillus chiayiensis]
MVSCLESVHFGARTSGNDNEYGLGDAGVSSVSKTHMGTPIIALGLTVLAVGLIEESRVSDFQTKVVPR